MKLHLKDIVVFGKKEFGKKDSADSSYLYHTIDYLYVDERNGLTAGRSYIDKASYDSLGEISANSDLKKIIFNSPIKVRGHYTNYKFVVDELCD